VESLEELTNIHYDGENFTKNVQFLDAEAYRAMMVYSNSEDCTYENFRTNIVIASFVTMYGRIKLYKLMKQIQDTPGAELLYYDTVG
jgi:hypothetical protein